MKYTKELTDKITQLYIGDEVTLGLTAKEIAVAVSTEDNIIPERSIIAKLSSLGVYKKKGYLTKRGEIPVKKEEYIDRIAKLLDVQADFLESLEKVNKGVLALIATKLSD